MSSQYSSKKSETFKTPICCYIIENRGVYHHEREVRCRCGAIGELKQLARPRALSVPSSRTNTHCLCTNPNVNTGWIDIEGLNNYLMHQLYNSGTAPFPLMMHYNQNGSVSCHCFSSATIPILVGIRRYFSRNLLSNSLKR